MADSGATGGMVMLGFHSSVSHVLIALGGQGVLVGMILFLIDNCGGFSCFF